MSSPERKWILDWKMEVVLELLRGGDAGVTSRSDGISQTQLFECGGVFGNMIKLP